MKNKKYRNVICAILLLSLTLVACGTPSEKAQEGNAKTTTEAEDIDVQDKKDEIENSPEIDNDVNITGDDMYKINLDGISTTDDLEVRIEEHLASCIESLKARSEELRSEIDTYDKYCEQESKVSEFYTTIEDETNSMCIMLREYSAAYARMILDSDIPYKDKYKMVDDLKDCLYDDACDEINDEIYEGIMDDMKEHFYEGILEDAKDSTNYSDWYDTCSDEYSQWYDTASEVYSLYYDTASDIYSFYYDIAGELYSGDLERAEKIYSNFLDKISKKKNTGDDGTVKSDAVFDISIRNADSIDELEETIDTHVSECVQALVNEWIELSSDVDSYEKYCENVDEIENFHKHIEDSSEQILQMISEYCVVYANLIMESDSSAKDKYKEMEGLKDSIYDDACDLVKDEIYDDLFDSIKDYYYEGILKDAEDYVSYSEWSDIRGDAYSWWSDSRGEVYSEWSDVRSDIYSFWSDMRSELFSGDIEDANKEIQKFDEKLK